LLADGVDPLERKRAEAARSITFAQAAEQYAVAHEPSWTNARHRQQFINTLRADAFPRLGQQPVDAIDEAMVLSVLKPIWHDKTVSAQRLRNRIEKVLDYATAAKFRTGDNPARWSILKHFLARPRRSPG
jgi:predicted RNase H-like nuclease